MRFAPLLKLGVVILILACVIRHPVCRVYLLPPARTGLFKPAKEMFMLKITHVTAIILLASASVAPAQTTPAAPITQGVKSVKENLSGNPDNPGLQNAAEQLQENQARQAEKRSEQAEKKETRSVRNEKTERLERTERHEKVERPAKMERPGK